MEFLNKKTIWRTSLFTFLILMAISSLSESMETSNDGIKLFLYTRENRHYPNVAASIERLVNFEDFELSNPSVFFINEFEACSFKYQVDEIVADAYLEEGPYNFISIDWSGFKEIDFSESQVYKRLIYHIAKLFYELHRNHIIFSPQLHVIGFGKGAHIAAGASRNLQQLGASKIGRITGLNPIYVESSNLTDARRYLHKSSATYVDIIFTASDFPFKNVEPIGHVDFYVNFAQVQSTCGHDFCCKHNYAWKYYVNSVFDPHKYYARKCDFQPHELICTIAAGQYMGIASNSSEPGVFHVEIADGLMGDGK